MGRINKIVRKLGWNPNCMPLFMSHPLSMYVQSETYHTIILCIEIRKNTETATIHRHRQRWCFGGVGGLAGGVSGGKKPNLKRETALLVRYVGLKPIPRKILTAARGCFGSPKVVCLSSRNLTCLYHHATFYGLRRKKG